MFDAVIIVVSSKYTLRQWSGSSCLVRQVPGTYIAVFEKSCGERIPEAYGIQERQELEQFVILES